VVGHAGGKLGEELKVSVLELEGGLDQKEE